MRSVYEVSRDIAAYAPNGGATWQNVGMRQVPVRLLTELREAVERERRVKVAWQATPIEADIQWAEAGPSVIEPAYAGAWRFDGPQEYPPIEEPPPAPRPLVRDEHIRKGKRL